MYEAFISLIPFERQDVGAACDRHRSDRDFVKQGEVFVALHDQTYGSLRLSGRIVDAGLLIRVLERTAELLDTGDLREAEPLTARALEDLTAEARQTIRPFRFDKGEIPPSPRTGLIRVIMPGSRGLNLLRNNEEFEVKRVFFSQKLQAVAYGGRHLATVEEDVVEIVGVDSLAPIPGESRLGQYDPESGYLDDTGVLP